MIYRIALDAMGGDDAPQVIIDGAKAAIEKYDDIEITLVGKEAVLSPLKDSHERLKLRYAEDTIEMCDQPVAAVRRKKDASMVVAMNMVRNKEAEAVITAGSTGAMIAGATLIIRRIEGVERPALAPVLPTLARGALLIDCGANVECRPSHLRQFGIMGSIYMENVMGIENPRVGLINNGTEDSKGTDLVKEAHALLKETNINYIGNMESREIMLGGCDVAVTDGFTGNIMMKFAEGMGKAIFSMLKKELMGSFISKIGAMLSKSAFKNMKKRMDYKEYGGALLLGVNGVAVKAHGNSDVRALVNAIGQARTAIAGDIVNKISRKIEEYYCE